MTTETTTRLLPFACGLKWKHLLVAMILYFGGSYYALQAQPFSEYFDDITSLPGNGWAFVNASIPVGPYDWEQGDYTTFSGINGGGDYIAGSHQNTAGAGTVSNWLMSPVRTFNNGDTISFYTRTVGFPIAPDRLRWMLSVNGASTDPADFIYTLFTINEGLTITGYPTSWTRYGGTLTGLPAGGLSGRFAFWYDVPNGGPYGVNSDYIGIDEVVYSPIALSTSVVLNCPANQTEASGQTQAQINAAFATWLATASASGGCNGALSDNNTGAPPASGGNTTVTFTYTSTCEPLTTTCPATFTVAATPLTADLALVKTANDVTPDQNQVITFTLVVSNAGPDPATNFEVTDFVPAGMTYVVNSMTGPGTYVNGAPATTGLKWQNLSLPNGGSLELTFQATVTAAGGSVITNFAQVSASAEVDPDSTPNNGNIGEDDGDIETVTVNVPNQSVLTCPVPTTASACLTQAQLDAVYDDWLTSATASGGCNGSLTNDSQGVPSICSATAVTRTVIWTYTSTCAPTTTSCSSTFTVPAYPTFTLPANGAATVACPALAVQPTPPSVLDGCGKTLTPTGPAVSNVPNPLTCEGTRIYSWTYTDCAGHVLTWSFVYTIERNPFTVPANGAATVNSPASASQPTPPTVTSNCGETLTPTGPVVTNSPDPIVCTGTRTYAWTYTDCEGNTAVWSFVYTILDNEPPMATCSNSTVTFNGQQSITLNANNFVTATDNCGIQSIALNPTAITCQQVGQQVPVTATVMDVNGNTATCTSMITVSGLPCGWSQNPDGVGCENGNSISFNTTTSVYTATSTGCFYGPPYTADETALAQRTLCGNGSITALVTGISGNALGWAGVVMRESNAAGAKKVQLMTNLSNLSRREFRTSTNGASQPQQFPSQGRYWLRITRVGNQFTMFVSANGTSWFPAGTQNIVMSNCIQLGLAATNYTANSAVTATFANVSFTGSNPIFGTNINEVAQSIDAPRGFEVYPNPTGGELNVDLANYVGRMVRLEVYSLEGKLLQFSEIDEVQNTLERLDLKGFQSGMYLLKVKSAGLPDATKRIVLQRG